MHQLWWPASHTTEMPSHRSPVSQMWTPKPLRPSLPFRNSDIAQELRLMRFMKNKKILVRRNCSLIAAIEDGPPQMNWSATVTINAHHINFKIDTGAQCNVISYQPYQSIATNNKEIQLQAGCFLGTLAQFCGQSNPSL